MTNHAETAKIIQAETFVAKLRPCLANGVGVRVKVCGEKSCEK